VRVQAVVRLVVCARTTCRSGKSQLPSLSQHAHAHTHIHTHAPTAAASRSCPSKWRVAPLFFVFDLKTLCPPPKKSVGGAHRLPSARSKHSWRELRKSAIHVRVFEQVIISPSCQALLAVFFGATGAGAPDYLLYWYKSTNTDADSAAGSVGAAHCARLLALLVQKYKY
jgi:hypothetical protein